MVVSLGLELLQTCSFLDILNKMIEITYTRAGPKLTNMEYNSLKGLTNDFYEYASSDLLTLVESEKELKDCPASKKKIQE